MHPTTNPAETRRRALRGLLIALGYGVLNRESVVRHVDSHGSAETALCVRQCHRALVDHLIAEHNSAAVPAAFWPNECDDWRWVPTDPTEGRARTLAGKAVASCA